MPVHITSITLLSILPALVTAQGVFDDSNLQEDALRLHNAYRARHNAPPLTWSTALQSTAQAWSNQCRFEHGGAEGAGQNLGLKQLNVIALIDQFYDEVRVYHRPQFSLAAGHFTQLVWKETRELGCAVRQDCPDGPLWTCHYYPPGNVEGVGQYTRNVHKGKGPFTLLGNSLKGQARSGKQPEPYKTEPEDRDSKPSPGAPDSKSTSSEKPKPEDDLPGLGSARDSGSSPDTAAHQADSKQQKSKHAEEKPKSKQPESDGPPSKDTNESKQQKPKHNEAAKLGEQPDKKKCYRIQK